VNPPPSGASRVLHTSDWHLGVELTGQSRRPDHLAAIESLVTICRDFRPDAVVHTGDLFDHARPGADDQAIAVEALRRLAAIAPVVVVAGNHDNGAMLDGVWDRLAGAGKIHFRGRLRRPEAGGAIRIPTADGARSIVVCSVPFVTPHSFARWDQPGETTTSYTDGIKRVHDAYDAWLNANIDPATDKVIWAAHLLVSGARPAMSERRVHLGDDYATSAAHIPAVAYAAFGHIHIPQELPGLGTGRYAGSMLPLRFDEAADHAERKSVVLVELPPTGAPRTELVELDIGRPLVEIRARLEELPARAGDLKGALVRVTVTLDGPVPALARQVADALAGAVVVEVHPEFPAGARAATVTAPVASSLGDLLERWLDEHPVVGADPDRTATIVRSLVEAATSRRRVPLVGEGLLDKDLAAELGVELSDELDWADPDADEAVLDSLGLLDDGHRDGSGATTGKDTE
jgi:exonuclease SbcD